MSLDWRWNFQVLFHYDFLRTFSLFHDASHHFDHSQHTHKIHKLRHNMHLFQTLHKTKTVTVQKIAANANDQPSTSFSRIPLTAHTFMITSYDYVYFYLTVFFSIQFYFTTFLLNDTTDQQKIKFKNKNTQNITTNQKRKIRFLKNSKQKIYLIETIFN